MKKSVFTFLALVFIMAIFTSCVEKNSTNGHMADVQDAEKNLLAIETDSNFIEIKLKQDVETEVEMIIEIDDKLIIFYSTQQNEDEHKINSLAMYEVSSSREIYTINQEKYLDFGELLRIDKESEIEGYDYKLIFEKAIVESINGWIKEEMNIDFQYQKQDNLSAFLNTFVDYFNLKRPAYALNYKTPAQFKTEQGF